VHGDLHPVERKLHFEDLFGICNLSRISIERTANGTLPEVSMTTRRDWREARYPELEKSVKERYIRVAAIVIPISAGV
jgi:hypothetical protein